METLACDSIGLAFGASQVGVAVLRGEELRFALVSPAYQALKPTCDFLGRTLAESYPELADTVIPLLRGVLHEDKPFRAEDVKLALRRGSPPVLAEGSFTFGFDPLPPDEAGRRGILVTVVETTASATRRADEAVQRSEQLHRLLFATMTEGVVWQEASGEITLCNPAAERILGLTREQMMGRTSMDPRWRAVHEDGSPFPGSDHPAMITLRTGNPVRGVVMGVHKPDGSRRWIRIDSDPVLDGDGRTQAAVATFVDISEQFEREQVLRQVTRRLEAVLEASADGFWERDVAAGNVFHSARMNQMLGLPPVDRVAGDREFVDRIHPGDRAAVLASFSDVMAGRAERFELEFRVRLQDGAYRWLQSRGKVTARDAAGKPLRISGALSDIQVRKTHEEALRITVEVLERHLVNTPLAVIEWDRDNRVKRFSGHAEEMFGWSAAEVLGKRADEIGLVPDEEWPLVRAVIARLTSGAQSSSVSRHRNRRKDGTVIHCDWHDSALYQDGERVSILSLVQDVTAREQAGAALKERGDLLLALMRRLEAVREEEQARMARDLHDGLGQVLTAVQLNLRGVEGRLERQPASPEVGAMLDRVVETSELAREALKSVQHIARNTRPAALDRLGLAAALHQEARRFEERTGIAVTLALEGDAPSGSEVGTALFRIGQEALTNVARHAAATRVELALRRQEGQLVLEVQDDGGGLPADRDRKCQSLGLVSMRERASMLGGDAQFGQGRLGGARISVRVPLPPSPTQGQR